MQTFKDIDSKMSQNIIINLCNNGKDNMKNDKISNLVEFTKRDFEEMSIEEQIMYDKRSFCRYYLDYLLEDHIFFRAFLLKSLLVPQYIRIHTFFFFICLIFALSGLLYEDGLHIISSQFFYAFYLELPKSIWTSIISIGITFILRLILYIPREFAHDLNNSFKKHNIEEMKIAYEIYKRRMRWRYILYMILTLLIEGLIIYFLVIFCNIYSTVSIYWFQNSMVSIILGLLILEFVIPLMATIIRTIILNFKYLRFLYYFQYIFLLLKMIG